ncbi:hypothetical protein RsTz2092_05200 [Deferribacterales bacterium RsTz2092]|nr:hypothetical protein AGMMS49941_04030 [Deferribacterales bacterium]
MDRFFRYCHFLKSSNFGFSLPSGAIANYLKFKLGTLPDILPSGYSFPILDICATRRCNLSCSFCTLGGFPKDWQKFELTPQKFENILAMDMFKKSIFVVLEGGEPLLNKDLPELVAMARAKKHLVGLITNGLLLGERAKDLQRAGVCDMQVSVYDNTYDKLTKILPSVSHLFPMNASYVLLKSKLEQSANNNFSEIIDIIKMCKDAGCASLKFNIVVSTYSTRDFSEIITDTSAAMYSDMISVCKNNLKGVSFSGYNSKGGLPTKQFTVFFPAPTLLEAPTKRACRVPWMLLNMDANGNFVPCCVLRENYGMHGNVLEDVDSLNADKLVRIRRSLMNSTLPLEPECVGCVKLIDEYMSTI